MGPMSANVRGGPDRDDAGQGQRRARRRSQRCGHARGRAHDAHVQLMREMKCPRRSGPAPDQRRIFQPLNRLCRSPLWCRGHAPAPHLGRRRHGPPSRCFHSPCSGKVRRQNIAQFLVVHVRIDARGRPVGQHQKARRAEAALQGVMLDERLLQRVQRAAPCARPSTVRMSLAFGLHGEHQAGAHRLAVDEDRAGAADAVFAARYACRSGRNRRAAHRPASCAARLRRRGCVH